MNREEYLEKAIEELKPLFKRNNYELPGVKVTCSWPGGGSARTRIGECWARAASSADINEIFISPVIDDSVRALDILVHELCHAVDDCQNGHRKPFGRIARAVGLEGKLTATVAGEALTAELIKIVEKIGEYPHKALNPGQGRKKQTTRMIKIECDDCGAVFRMSRQWAAQVNACPCCRGDQLTIA